MDVNHVSKQAQPVASSPLGGMGGQAAEAGKNTFLQLLVAQLEHQDPLSPMENAEFTSQLAQFSSLEQMEAMNANLTSLVAAQEAMNGVQAAALIGKDITAQGNTTQVHQGTASPLQYSLAANSAKVTINIFNQTGQLVQTIEAGNQGAGEQIVPWQGNGAEQLSLPDGVYHFEVAAADGSGNPVAVDTFMQGRVDGVEYDANQAYLLVGDNRVKLNQVVSVHDQG
jgi:flagellar basal-body rod modification protein FlgD